MRLLAFDVSSTNIGWIYAIDGVPQYCGLITLAGKPHQRLAAALGQLQQLRQRHPVDRLIIEAPIQGPGKLALIQQQRMVGLVLAVCATASPAVEVYPNTAKKALTGSGTADKALMLSYAYAVLGNGISEHEADALGVLYAGWAAILEEIRRESERISKQRRKKAA